LLETMSGVSV